MPQLITTLEQLKNEASEEEGVEVFILLSGGIRSSKTIKYYDNTWDVYNHVDDTTQDGLKDLELRKETNIVEALEKGALYMY